MDTSDKVLSDLGGKIFFYAIANCLENGEISKDDNIEEIKKVVLSKMPMFLDNLSFKFIYTDSLEKAIKLLLKQKLYDEAIIIAMTCIEHMLNYFYGEYFERRIKMSTSNINDLLKSTSTADKIGALYLLSFSEEFPNQLYSQIIELNKRRNYFVHYKPPKVKLDDWDKYDKKDDESKRIALTAPKVIDNLAVFLQEKSNELYESNVIAQEIFNEISHLQDS